MRSALFLLLAATAMGCAEESVPKSDASAPASTTRFVGTWKVAADTAGQGHTGTMELKSDGTFESIYNGSKSKDTASGTYAVTTESGSQVVSLTITTYNGATVPPPPPIKLFYDPAKDMLNDMLTVAYARSTP